MKVAHGTAYVPRLAAYVEDGADDPEQALMEISNSHARYPDDSLIAASYFEQRAAVYQAAGQATAGDADPDRLPRHRTHGDGSDYGGHACQQKENRDRSSPEHELDDAPHCRHGPTLAPSGTDLTRPRQASDLH
jgi:hypothetical protein